MRGSRWIASFTFWSVAGISGVASAQSPSPTLDWLSAGDVALTAGQTSVLEVLNRSNDPVDLKVSLIWSGETVSGGPPKQVSIGVDKNSVEAGGVAIVSITPGAEDPGKSYSFSGVLLVRGVQSGSSAGSLQRNVSFSSTAEGGGGATQNLRFLAGTVKLRKYLIWELGDPAKDAFVPLSPSVYAGEGGVSIPDVYLNKEDGGDIVRVTFGPSEPHPGNGLMTLPFSSFSKFAGAGTYSGTLTAQDSGTDANKSVMITVTAAHHPVFALGAILLGLFVSLGIQRYTGFLRPYRALQLRALELGRKIPADFQGFSVSAEFQKRHDQLIRDIEILPKSAFATLDEASPEYVRIKAELEALEEAAGTWAGFRNSVESLIQALDLGKWDLVSKPPVTTLPERPKIFYANERLSQGRTLSLEGLKALAPQISAGLLALELWKALNARAQGLAGQIRALLQLVNSPDEKSPLRRTWERIEKADENLLELRYRLWVDETPDFSLLNESLDGIEAQLWIDEGLLPKTEALGTASEERRNLRENVIDLKILLDAASTAASAREPRVYERMALLLRARSRRAELLIATLAFLIAVYTALNAEYFDQPFGTWRDYADIVAWAVGTGALSDLLLRALDRLWVLGANLRRTTTS